jgi:hypothetical protein
MTSASLAGSAELDVYADWALIMARMIDASVGSDPWTVVERKIHPTVAEPEFAPLDLSYLVFFPTSNLCLASRHREEAQG